jgi:hypothetical protein
MFTLVRAQTRAERKSKAEKAKKKRPTPYIRTTAKATSSSGNNASGLRLSKQLLSDTENLSLK